MCSVVIITEEVTAIGIEFFFLFDLFLLLSRLVISLNGRGNNNSVLSGILKLFSSGEGVIGSERNGAKVLESVDHKVRSSRLGDVSRAERQGSQVGNGGAESGNDILVVDGENAGGEKLALVVDHLDLHLIEERLDLKLIKEGRLRTGNLLIFENNLDIINDFDLTLNNLGLDRQVLEERCLLGIETSGTGSNPHIIGSDLTNSSGSLTNLFFEDFLNIGQITIMEDDTSVTLELFNNSIEFGSGLPGILSFLVVFITLYGLGHQVVDAGFHEGVLSHDHGSTHISELSSDEADLLGGNVIDLDEESLLVFGADVLKAFPVDSFLSSFVV